MAELNSCDIDKNKIPCLFHCITSSPTPGLRYHIVLLERLMTMFELKERCERGQPSGSVVRFCLGGPEFASLDRSAQFGPIYRHVLSEAGRFEGFIYSLL